MKPARLRSLLAAAALSAFPAAAPAAEDGCVILLHGLGRSGTSLILMEELLASAGFRVLNYRTSHDRQVARRAKDLDPAAVAERDRLLDDLRPGVLEQQRRRHQPHRRMAEDEERHHARDRDQGQRKKPPRKVTISGTPSRHAFPYSARNACSNASKSSGGAASNRTFSPVTGCTNPSVAACSACRPKPATGSPFLP